LNEDTAWLVACDNQNVPAVVAAMPHGEYMVALVAAPPSPPAPVAPVPATVEIANVFACNIRMRFAMLSAMYIFPLLSVSIWAGPFSTADVPAPPSPIVPPGPY
jgi:hypothetical protein